MTMIQKPSKGRVVIFTAWRGQGPDSGKTDEYTALVVNVHPDARTTPDGKDPVLVDLVTFGPHSMYHNNSVPYSSKARAGTWRYPPRETEEVDPLDD